MVATKKTDNFPIDQTNEEEEKRKSLLLQKEHLQKDSSATFVIVEQEAEFPGGEKAWSKHVMEYLDLPDLVMAINKPQKMTDRKSVV